MCIPHEMFIAKEGGFIVRLNCILFALEMYWD